MDCRILGIYKVMAWTEEEYRIITDFFRAGLLTNGMAADEIMHIEGQPFYVIAGTPNEAIDIFNAHYAGLYLSSIQLFTFGVLER